MLYICMNVARKLIIDKIKITLEEKNITVKQSDHLIDYVDKKMFYNYMINFIYQL